MKKTFMRSLLAVSVLTTLPCVSAFAAAAADGPAAECEGVSVATGPKGKGYSLLFADLKKVCGSKVPLCEVNTTGGLDNLNSLSTKDADVGVVQVDTWNDMKAGDENIAALQKVLPLNYNYLHVVTSANGFAVKAQPTGKLDALLNRNQVQQVLVQRFSDLRGQTVAVVGSAALLVRRLNQQLGYKMNFIDAKSDDAAFDLVKKGQAAAAMTVSGWPSGTVKLLDTASGLTLVPFDAPIGEPYKVKSLNYKNLAVYNNNSLGVPNVMVTRSFSGQRAANIAALQSCILNNLTDLKEGKYQPAWNEVNPSAQVPGMADFKKK
mgnify:CR=1 FL=1